MSLFETVNMKKLSKSLVFHEMQLIKLKTWDLLHLDVICWAEVPGLILWSTNLKTVSQITVRCQKCILAVRLCNKELTSQIYKIHYLDLPTRFDPGD